MMLMNEIYTKKNRVFQRSDKTDPFNYSDGDETENYLLRIIEEAADLSISSPHWNQYIIDWPAKYHLSPQRADLLRPFQDSFKDKSVLEIGCGCGAVTRFLGETGATVTALEGSTRRCRITAARCRDLPNVRVVCDNFQDFHTNDKYDNIVLVGVLEYSNMFIDGVHSARELLRMAKSMLKPGGSLIIGIENKLGLKYWAGAPEDHVGKPYFGIENRYDDHTPQTYGRVELENLLHSAGLVNTEFLYPFPDYKLPSIILREKSMQANLPAPANLIIPATDHPQFKSYHPNFVTDRAWKEVINNALTPDMANSFLVVASGHPATSLLPAETLAYIYSSGRYPTYRKANTFVQTEAGTIIKRALINEGYPARETAGLQQVIKDEDYIPGTIYFLGFQDIISKAGWTIEQLVEWCAPYYKYAMKLSMQSGRVSMINGSFLDLTPFNLIKTPYGELKHFDQEWVTGDQLPLRYIIFRGLYFCFSRPLYFMPPASGTPLNAFELITKIISAFEQDSADVSDEFRRLEHKYFGPVSVDPNYVPVNFQVNLFVDAISPSDQLTSLAIPPLAEIAVKCYYGNEGEEFSEINSISSLLELVEERVSYTFRFKQPPESPNLKSGLSGNPAGDVRGDIQNQSFNKIRICLSDQPGLINFYSYLVKDNKGNRLASSNAGPAAPLQLRDVISIEGKSGHPHFGFIMFAGEPAIEISLPPFRFEGPQSYLDVIIELSQANSIQHAELRRSLYNLLSFDRYLVAGANDKEPVRNQLVSIAQRLSKDARTDLEKRLAGLEFQLENLQSEITDEHSMNETLKGNVAATRSMEEENARLMKTIEWYRDTYEKRSLAGIIITRLKGFLQRVYLGILHFLLGRNFVKNRYALNYMLEYTRDNGLRNAVSSVRKNFSEHRFKTFTNARRLALEAMNKAAAAKSPRPAEPSAEEIYPPEKMKKDIQGFRLKPLISVIMPTYNTRPALLKLAIDSIRSQVYKNWELCIVDDGSSSANTKEFLRNYENDPRIKIRFLEKNVGISEASNHAIKMSTGDLIALFDHDDELTPDALFWVCRELNEYPDTDIIYSDECKKDEKGATSDYFLKPDWSPQLLLNMMYVGHLTVYKKSFLLEKVGMFRSAFDFSQDYDLILRATEKTNSIRHIPRVLYYWRQTAGSAAQGDKPYARASNLKALADAMTRRNIDAEIIDLPTANRVRVNLEEQPAVSIIIPTDSIPNLTATINSITAITKYTNYEIVPVTNSGVIAALSEQYQGLNMNFVRYDKPYNFSDKCNAGAHGSNSPILIFLNDDVRPLQGDWIENTIEYLLLPGVGGVSPKLIYEDDSIQYAGMVTGVRNLTGTSFHCYPANSTAYINFPQLTRDVSILSGACLAMKKELFLSIDGFDAVNTPSAHSDVDLSFKIIEAGFRCIYTPYAELRHIGHLSLKTYEEQNTKHKKDKADIYLLSRWPTYVACDPYFPYPMRDLLYHDSPVPLKIFPGRQSDYKASGKDVILVCHDLTRSGAPIMLYNICTVLLRQGYFVVVFCAKDGPLKSMYNELGVTVILDPLILANHQSFEKFAINFDYIICNTVVNWPIVRQMQDKVKTVWWLQEAKVIDHFINEKEFIPTLSSAYNIVGVSDYSLGMIRKYNSNYRKIYNACYDFYEPAKHDKDLTARINFTIVGSIESRKGHDVLFKALGFIEEEILERLSVKVVGRVLDPNFDAMIRQQIPPKALITFTGEIPNAEAVQLVAGADVIVCPSRDDPFPVVLVEGFCMAKTCLVSDATGFAELIEHGQNGFVFASEDAEELADIMRNIVLRSAELDPIGRNAREVYLRELSIPVLEQRLLPYLEALPDPALKQTRRGKVTYKKTGTTFQITP
jgi:GT2 family glycosyltransferase/SAM-dependent methyltransferase